VPRHGGSRRHGDSAGELQLVAADERAELQPRDSCDFRKVEHGRAGRDRPDVPAVADRDRARTVSLGWVRVARLARGGGRTLVIQS
jgi:hypothetical protein